MVAKPVTILQFTCLRVVTSLVVVIALNLPNSLAQARQTSQAQKAKPAPVRTVSDEEINEARLRLVELGYWLDPHAKGLDASLRHALVAFQKVGGRARTGLLTSEELQAMRVAQSSTPLESGYPHIEIDLCRQVLFVVEVGNTPLRILPVSTGSGEYFTEGGVTRRAVTTLGRFTVKYKIMGWRKSALGLLYYPNYIHGGIAIHGSPSVPVQPASHGCIRIPMFAAKEFSELATIGLEVFVYENCRRESDSRL